MDTEAKASENIWSDPQVARRTAEAVVNKWVVGLSVHADAALGRRDRGDLAGLIASKIEELTGIWADVVAKQDSYKLEEMCKEITRANVANMSDWVLTDDAGALIANGEGSTKAIQQRLSAYFKAEAKRDPAAEDGA